MAYFYGRAWREAGHEMLLVHGPEPAASILPEMRELGIELHPEPGLAFPLSRFVHRRVARVAGAWGSQALIGWNQRDRAVALEAAGRIPIPGLAWIGNLHRFWGPWPFSTAKRLYYTSVLRRLATLIMCVSEAVFRQVVDEFGVDPARACLLPNGVDVTRFGRTGQRAAVRASLGVGPDELLLLNVGRIDHQKGLDILVEALAQVVSQRPWRLACVGGATIGSGEQRSHGYWSELRSQARRLGLEERVRFLGWRDDVPALLEASDVYVHAARYEGWPLAVIEAMAAGRPVVATDCVGRPTGFEDGVHGFIVKTGSVEELAAAVSEALALSDEERTRWGEDARELAREHYDVRVSSKRFVSLVEGLL